MIAEKSRNIFFLVPPEVQLLDLTGPAHIFYEAREYGAAVNIYYLSLCDTITEVSSAGLSINNLQFYGECQLKESDILFLPGLESHLFLSEDFIQDQKPFFEWLMRQNEHSAKICSVCTGAYLLAFAGLLNHKQCTTHWKYFEDFSTRFPKVRLLKNRLLIKDHNIYSSAGVSSGIDLALFLLEELYGPIFSADIAKEVVIYFRRTENDPQLSVFTQYRNHVDNRIHQVQDLVSQNLSRKIKIEELAEIVHISPRNLTRLFKKTIGLTLGNYIDKLRVEHAQKLLNEGDKVGAVTLACGLKSPNQLRALLKKHLQKLPSELIP